ncbi:peroxiredoxin-like family protein [Flavobacterium sp. I3-2]|uniref:peroxiredoxin-like family protein n=1 Tax=Flavobacterium sp. I3-2 TaxID=2748319 RepID=UPI0015B0BC96|nr:peroxiredoxin-like family protein [Flavobacterium sp. I3-2]
MDILAKQIDELNKQLTAQVPSETLQAFQKSIQDLKEKQIENKSLNIGDKFPDFELNNFDNKKVVLRELLENEKIVIAFLRGSWCPYCNLEIQALQTKINQFKNTRLIVISPQLETTNSEWQKQHHISFEILSDKNNDLAKQVGIDFELQDFVISHYENLGIDLLKINQTENHVLPIPAVYVLNSNATIIYKFVNANYMERINIDELIQQL